MKFFNKLLVATVMVVCLNNVQVSAMQQANPGSWWSRAASGISSVLSTSVSNVKTALSTTVSGVSHVVKSAMSNMFNVAHRVAHKRNGAYEGPHEIRVHRIDLDENNVDAGIHFVPDFHFKEQLPEDQACLEAMDNLFYREKGMSRADARKRVFHHALRNNDTQSINLLTEDNYRIAALYFKRPEAPVNIIYVTGYFNEVTPGKEWAASLAGTLFKEFNCLTFDWRGFGDSQGEHGLVNGFKRKNSFGTDAYLDIQAAIDFMKKQNNKPVILVGFCFGGAMAIHHTVRAKKEGRATADGLVLNCLFTRFENMIRRGDDPTDPLYVRACIKLGVAEWFLTHRMSGSLFSIPPIELIKEIDVPCYFEHFTGDPFAILDEGIEVYKAATCPKMFTQSDVGRHVRIHSKAPWQERIGFLEYLRRFDFITQDYFTNELGVTERDCKKAGMI